MRRETVIAIAVLVVISVIVAGVMLSLRQQVEEEITPNDEFFTTSLTDPLHIDIENYTLEVFGLIQEPANLTYQEMLAMPSTTEKATLRCVTGGTGTAIWKGVRISELMEMVGVLDGARELVFRSPDGFSTSLTLDDAMRSDVLLAYEMNGVPLPEEQGLPLRLVSPNQYGYKWAKWVVSIEVVDYDYKGYWESRGWDDGAYISLERDWWVHATIMMVGAVLGTFSLVSGVQGGNRFSKKVKKLFSLKFHIYTGYLFAVIMIPVFLYWSLETLVFRGNVYYSLHGALGLAMVLLLILSMLTGRYASLKRASRAGEAHLVLSVAMIVLLFVTIVLGFALAYL
ncbi:MAG: molybdopterin-dependent oxidoreductase [Methanomassiliicoccales archaeon]|nr:molybdopterin-dependent oxidoreductase [Methanomassiliicoccales archaeon]NYT16158.1 molybdopterin-dependent oxidoreductase [Methanomassiliicoccales archaeon]